MSVPHIAVRFDGKEPVGFYPERGTNLWATLAWSSSNSGLANPDPLATKYKTGETTLVTQEVPRYAIPQLEQDFQNIADKSAYSILSKGVFTSTHNCASAAAKLSQRVQEKFQKQPTLECALGNQITTHCKSVPAKP